MVCSVDLSKGEKFLDGVMLGRGKEGLRNTVMEEGKVTPGVGKRGSSPLIEKTRLRGANHEQRVGEETKERGGSVQREENSSASKVS